MGHQRREAAAAPFGETLPYPILPYPALPCPTLPYPTLPYPGVCLLCASTTQRFDMGNCHGMAFFELESCLCRMTAIEPSRIQKKQPPREGCLRRRLGNTLLQQGAIQSTVGACVCVCVRPAEPTQHPESRRVREAWVRFPLGPARGPARNDTTPGVPAAWVRFPLDPARDPVGITQHPGSPQRGFDSPSTPPADQWSG